ncbi:MAG: TetR/AcrR family transcriptional regulator [Solirubrobacteraceae bacterium]
MRTVTGRSRKGEQRAETIIDAALRCLARDGYAATSLQRVGDESSLGKRAVVYYFGSRDGLFDHVVRVVGGRLVDQLEQSVLGLEDPADIVARGFERMWEAITSDRALLVAWFGLRTEAITNDGLRPAANYITDRMRAVIAMLIDNALARGRVLHMRRPALDVLILAGIQGLILEYVERGSTPDLHDGIAEFRVFLEGVSSVATGP